MHFVKGLSIFSVLLAAFSLWLSIHEENNRYRDYKLQISRLLDMKNLNRYYIDHGGDSTVYNMVRIDINEAIDSLDNLLPHDSK